MGRSGTNLVAYIYEVNIIFRCKMENVEVGNPSTPPIVMQMLVYLGKSLWVNILQSKLRIGIGIIFDKQSE